MSDINKNIFFEIVGTTPSIDRNSLTIGQTLVKIKWDQYEKYFVVTIFHRKSDGTIQGTVPVVLNKWFLDLGLNPEGWV